MNRRAFRNYFPEPRFQAKFVSILVGGAILQIAFTYSVVAYFVSQNYQMLVKYAGVEPEILAILTAELKSLVWVMSGASLLFILGTILLGSIFSHRVAGPIYALKRTIRDIQAGKPVRLRFRDGDEFTEVADEFNSLIEDLKKKSVA